MLYPQTNNYRIMKNFLFPRPDQSPAYSLFLLAFRVMFGILLMIHGLEKVYNYSEVLVNFPDPFTLGNQASLLLVIIAELFCPIAFIFGFLYRLCLIPMIVTMAVAFFYIHGMSLVQGELAFMYMLLFIMMYIAGAGKYSVDARIYRYMNREDDPDEDDIL